MSPLAQGRGLKHFFRSFLAIGITSPLAQGRGLKLANTVRDIAENFVAPRAGAWIETLPCRVPQHR